MELKIVKEKFGHYTVNNFKVLAFDVKGAINAYLSVHGSGSRTV